MRLLQLLDSLYKWLDDLIDRICDYVASLWFGR